MKPKIKVAFASGTDDLNARLIARMREVFPELPLYVVSEFPPAESDVNWVRYRGGLLENLARCRSAFHGKSIRLAGVLLVPNVPFRKMRVLALILAPFYFLAVNEHLNDFMLRPRSLPAIGRHILWRIGNFVRWHLGENGALARRNWSDIPYLAALIAGWLRIRHRRLPGASIHSKAGEATFCMDGAQYALYGDANSLNDPDKFRELGGLNSAYATTDVQYLDLCYRAWQQGWPTMGTSTITRFDPLDHLKFLARAVSSPTVFRHQWKLALKNLHAKADDDAEARAALWRAASIALRGGPSVTSALAEELIFALTNGSVTVYAGKPPSGKPRVLVASAYLPFPLSHGGAVRIHNLTERAAADWDQILVCFAETDTPPPVELVDLFLEIVIVRRVGSHAVKTSRRPEAVEQFASDAFRGALQLAVQKWGPVIAQLEFTQMAQYATDCAPARPVLVEHDVTFDLYQQLTKTSSDWDLQRELKLWRRFETAAWRDMDCVVTMSAKDQALVTGTRAVTLPNGVDLDRFRVSPREPEPQRLLFVGSFSHLPNIMAVAFFLENAWPSLREAVPDARLHIIAGANHEYFLDYQSRQVRLPRLDQPGIELEGFVSDVRPAYERAAVVIAPLVASAGTNLKILEAMACGRPVVSTPEGVNGLDLIPGIDFILAHTGEEMADAITKLFGSPEECRRLALAGRNRVERSYGWDAIAGRQDALYRELING